MVKRVEYFERLLKCKDKGLDDYDIKLNWVRDEFDENGDNE